MGGWPQGEQSLTVRLVEARTGKKFLDEVEKRRQQGMSFNAIGAEWGISGMSVWRHYTAQRGTRHNAAAR